MDERDKHIIEGFFDSKMRYQWNLFSQERKLLEIQKI